MKSRRNEQTNGLCIKNKQTKFLCSRCAGVAGLGDGVAEPRLAQSCVMPKDEEF